MRGCGRRLECRARCWGFSAITIVLFLGSKIAERANVAEERAEVVAWRI